MKSKLLILCLLPIAAIATEKPKPPAPTPVEHPATVEQHAQAGAAARAARASAASTAKATAGGGSAAARANQTAIQESHDSTTVLQGGSTLSGGPVSVTGDAVHYDAVKIPVGAAYAGSANLCAQWIGANGQKASFTFSRIPKVCKLLLMNEAALSMATIVGAACHGDDCGAKVDALMDSALWAIDELGRELGKPGESE